MSVPEACWRALEEVVGARQITREDSQRFISVQCNVSGRDMGGFVAEAQRAIQQRLSLPTGTLLTWGGQYRLQQEANARLAVVVPITLLLVSLLLVTSFGSIRNSLLILLNIPLALVGVSLSVAALPKFSSLLAAGERRGTASLFARGISGIVWVMLPATAGLIVLREPIVSLLFFQGAFEPAGVRETASALLFFCPGLCAMAGTRFFITLYCAGRETDVPFRAGLWAVLVNGLIAWPLMKLMDHQGLALGISISSWLNLVMLVRGVGQMMGPVSGRALCLDMTLFACRSLCASVIMAMIVQSFFNVLGLSPFSGKVALFLGVAGCVILGVIVYTGLFFLMGRFLAFIFKGEAE